MKTMKSKFYSLALAAGMLSLTACSDDNTNDSNNDKGNGIENGSTLKGTITEDVTLKAGNTYKLSGEYIVEAGATLNIEEGEKIIYYGIIFLVAMVLGCVLKGKKKEEIS